MKSSLSKPSPKRHNSQVQSYFDSLPAKAWEHMKKLRKAIRAAAPGAVESFGYGMPAFSLHGKPFVWYGAWKKHSSFYPLSGATRRALSDQVADYKTSGRGTIQFPFEKPLPETLVRRLVRARIAELRKKSR